MKRVLLLISIIAITGVAVAQSPVAYYPFNGNANDATGTVNGTVNGASLTTDRSGAANTAYSFNGTGNHINLGSSNTLRPTTALTVSAWFTLENTAGSLAGRNILSCTEASGYALGYEKTANNLQVLVRRNGSYAIVTTSATPYENTGWHHIAGTYDGRYTRLYIDGVLKTTDDAGGNFPVEYIYPFGNVNTYIGAEASAGFTIDPDYYWQGKIDEVKVFNTALTFSQVLTEYNNTVFELKHYYPFNNNANDIIGSLNAAVGGAASASDRFYFANSSYNFDGTDDFLLPGNTAFAAGDYSVSFWMNAADISGDRTMINGQDATDITKTFFLIDMSGGIIRFLHRTPPGNSGGIEIYSTQPIQVNKWYFITCTKQGSTITMYINGVQQSTATFGSVANIAGNVTINIGRLQNGPNSFLRHFAGRLDEIKFYNTAISAGKVQAEYGKPGSGNAMSFDGIDDRILVPHSPAMNTVQFTVSAWIKTSQPTTGAGDYFRIVYKQVGGAQNYSLAVHQNKAHIRFDHAGGPVEANSITNVNDGRWHHIAGVYNQSALQIYVDGVLENSTGSSAIPLTSTDPMYIGAAGNFTTQNYQGIIDELVVYNTALNQTQLRERMCRKITSADPLFSNLVAYFKFDENAVSNVFDESINLNAGTLVNGPARTVSGAPIGNSSSFNYSATPTTALIHPQGESLQATTTSGSPTGIHVYSVSEKPNSITGATGTGDNDRYFGVYTVGGTSPQYTAAYNYTGNPFVNAGNEGNLMLHKRDDNAATSWANSSAVLNTAANTLTATGQNTEYIVGLTSGTLPVTLLDFTASKQQDKVLLQWKTANEQNNLGFELLHSTDAVNFTAIGFVNGAGNSSSVLDYSVLHHNPAKGRNYYRLLQKDIDGRKTASEIKSVRFDDAVTVRVYPNPVKDFLTVQVPDRLADLSVSDGNGKLIWTGKNLNTGVHTIPFHQLASGIFIVTATGMNGNKTHFKISKT
jgi:Concanavalin A-like lectin/glucanases superfamily/Secretion system C-terminal sorting domain